VIEVAPLAYMRGRTLNDAFVILDEAQNTTSEQMKMFLTRIGFGSKAVVTGDMTQVDLPPKRTQVCARRCGLLKDVEGVSQTFLIPATSSATRSCDASSKPTNKPMPSPLKGRLSSRGAFDRT
jgi:phosphate starvation-inducible protein PhoH